jgi:hypothetical protein
MAGRIAEFEDPLDWITGQPNGVSFHFGPAATPEGVHWYDRHSVYRGGSHGTH